jgi:hypothetical protein
MTLEHLCGKIGELTGRLDNYITSQQAHEMKQDKKIDEIQKTLGRYAGAIAIVGFLIPIVWQVLRT